MKSRAELTYVSIGLVGLALLLVSFVLRREALSVMGIVVYVAAALVLASWTVMGVGASRRQAREAVQRRQREAQERARQEAQEAAHRTARVVNARRTTSHGGATIAVRRRSSNGQAE